MLRPAMNKIKRRSRRKSQASVRLADALAAARSLEHPDIPPPTKNPRARAILRLAGAYFRGECMPSPETRAAAAAILDSVRRRHSRS
jgi:hypothetical protein